MALESMSKPFVHFLAFLHTLVHLWQKLEWNGALPHKATAKHLLWAFHFLKVCGSEHELSTRVQTTHKTCWKWVWKMLVAITGLSLTVVHAVSFCSMLLALV